MLNVTAQQSRFHNEAIEASALKEIIVKDLSISIGSREILNHSDLQLQVGKHYVLVGRNGIGKSTFVQAIASEQIPSIPQGLRILLLGQTLSNLDQDLGALSLEEQTVVQHVISGDKKRERLIHEEKVLAAAVESTTDPTAAVKAYRQVCHRRLEQRTHDARQIAQRRSGARGAKARKILIQLEEEVKESEAKLQESGKDIEGTEMGEETQKAADLLAEIQTSLELMGASNAEAKARSVLTGLGFSKESIDRPMAQLSGGWKTRCSLACALCQSADLLLLDEPTNFLDLPSIIWLERYVQELPPTITVLVVTHDRSFADGVADELLVLRNHTLERFRGNLSAYELERIKNWKYLSRMKDAQDKQKKQMQSSVDQNVQAAKKAGDDKKMKQAALKKKKLDERMGMEVSAKGTRFKLNRDMPGYHLSNRDQIDVPTFDPPVRFTLPTTPPDLRFPGALVSFEKVSFAYPNRKQTPVLQDVDFTVHMGDRVGIAGMNGSGKSTLVSLVMAETPDSPALKPTAGKIERHARARFGLYTQQAVEQLDALAAKNKQATALSHLTEFVGTSLAEKDGRALLSSVGLAGKVVSDVPIALLSGGQKVRLALAKLMHTPPHLLILDEVTTHLDTDTVDALVHALRGYEGAVVVVTHDRFFMRCLVEGESPKSIARNEAMRDEEDGDDPEESEEDAGKERAVYRMIKGKLKKLSGGTLEYEGIAERASANMGKT